MSRGFTVSSGTARFAYTALDVPTGESITVGKKNAYELIIITSGIGIFQEDGYEHRLTRGAILLFTPGRLGEMYVSDSCAFRMYSVSFVKRDLISEAEHILDSVLLSFRDGGALISSSYSPERLISIFERSETAEGMPKEERRIYFKMLISEIVIFLSLADNTCGVYEERDLGARVAKYLDENIDRQISLDSLAKRFFVSKFYLCRAFKKRNGISPHSYINNKRVMYAKQLIESGESASSAAYKVGFGDYSAFYRAYVKVYGKSPTFDLTKEADV